MLAQRLEAANATTSSAPPPSKHRSIYLTDDSHTLLDTILVEIRKILSCGKKWLPTKHITTINTTVYIKINSHQLKPNGHPNSHARP